MHWKDIFEFTFYMVDTFALPFAIIVYVIERRKERQADEEELYQRLSDEYMTFLKLVLWCRNDDFRAALPDLLEGEDPDFQAHIRRIAAGTMPRRPGTAVTAAASQAA
jgi:hypothetical protein